VCHGDFEKAQAFGAMDSDIVLGFAGEAFRLFHVDKHRYCGCGGIDGANVHGVTLEKRLSVTAAMDEVNRERMR